MKQLYPTIKFIIQSIIVGLAIGFLFVYMKPEILNNKQNILSSPPTTTSYANAVHKISPSVVSIYANGEISRNMRSKPDVRGFSTLIPQTVTQQYLGSGVVMTSDGYIVTNFHVIKNATKIIVSLWDNSLLEANLIGSDSVTDIAVLKIEAINLTPAIFADSDSTQTGDIVLAIGNPYGLSQSVSLGIVSAKGRSGLSVSTIENFIQTDAAINEGNSGGALINTMGNVVGINTATFKRNGAQGINFAIPSNATKLIMQQILDNGKVLRGWLGVYLYTPQLFYRARITKPEDGVVVYTTFKKTPALDSGLQHNDIITRINDIEVTDEQHYYELIARTQPGETIEISGFTQGNAFVKKIQTIERPTDIN